MAHVLTVDVEDWYHVENFTEVAPPERWPELESRLEQNVDTLLELFGRHDVKATFFILGAAVEEQPGVVKAIAGQGHEVGCHGWSHELIYRQKPAVFEEETRRSKSMIEDLTGEPVAGYRASTFSITQASLWALDVLAEIGFAYDSSIAPLRHDRYGIPGSPKHPYMHELDGGRSLLEFPVSVMRVLGWNFPLGGGFFRLFPLGTTLGALSAYEAEGQSGMLYLHPWEFDPDQPRLPGLGALKRFRHYTGLRSSRAKLDRLLSQAEFRTMADVLAARFPDCGVAGG
ncbi:MAG: XrtA system polysaccharide deacetylase [Planctomycetota bacterium]